MSAEMTSALPPDHVSIEIDGQSLVVPKTATIIQAADRAGIPIPRFCYHPKLAVAASCRMCLVDVEKQPKPAPACATPVAEGMKVMTRSEKTRGAQQNVMELLLINHPLDCPICDQGGECELQDTALQYGRPSSRYHESKRVVVDEDLGPLVATEMTRCIQCTRCVRFMADVAGTYELGGMYRGEHLQIGTYDGQPLLSELSGNVIDVCPVGALTNKVYRFRARPWELIAHSSLGYHDALGSNLFLHARRGEVLRTVPKENARVNGGWLADRDRYSHQGLSHPERALVPQCKVDGGWHTVDWASALAAAVDLMRAAKADDLGFLVHPATSNEEGELLVRLAQGLNSGNIDHRLKNRDFSDPVVAQSFGLSVAEMDQADFVLLFGTHLRHELPLVHAQLRQAVTKQATQVVMIGPVGFDVAFPLASQHLVPPSAMAQVLQTASLRQSAMSARCPVIIVGECAENHPQAATLRAAVEDFAKATGARICRIPQGANALGLTRLGVLPTGKNVEQMVRQPCSTYLVYGAEPDVDIAVAGAMSVLTTAKTIAFCHYVSPAMSDVADIILPIAALPEMDATLTNLDGICQRAEAGGRPPGHARPGWQVLQALAQALSLPQSDLTTWAQVSDQCTPRSIIPSTSSRRLDDPSNGIEVVMTTGLYRTDSVVRRAEALQAHPSTCAPSVRMHRSLAQQLNLTEGQLVAVTTTQGKATLPLAIYPQIAANTLWIETGYQATAPINGPRVQMEAL